MAPPVDKDSQLKNDEWAKLMLDIREYRSHLLFSKRKVFDIELRPTTPPSSLIAYPDAFYMLTVKDFERAKAAVGRLTQT